MPLGWGNVWPCQWAGEMSGHAAGLGKRLAMPVGRGNVWPCQWAGEMSGHAAGLGKRLAMPVDRGNVWPCRWAGETCIYLHVHQHQALLALPFCLSLSDNFSDPSFQSVVSTVQSHSGFI